MTDALRGITLPDQQDKGLQSEPVQAEPVEEKPKSRRKGTKKR